MRFLATAALAAPALGIFAEPPTPSPVGTSAGESLTAQDDGAKAIDARALFLEHCASCHGEKGDGAGTADLDRPARSFLDGGYSYGNTQNAVVRSIRHGIPGTPMPAFEGTLDAAQQTAVADYVIALGPPGTIVEPGKSVMTVGDVPAIVHGMLPSLARGELNEPRALLLGFPNGTTFAYRKGDSGLVALFVGDFLDRADWGDRGGSPLQPLGTLAWRPDGGALGAADIVTGEEGAELRRRIVAATVAGADSARLDFDLRDAAGTRVGGGQEIIDFIDVGEVPVAVRFLVATGSGAARFAPLEASPIAVLEEDGWPRLDVRKAGDGLFALDVTDRPAARVLVHADKWSTELATALQASLGGPRAEANTNESNEGGKE